MSLYLVFKVLHILFMVSWFAGIFYLPRLFVYHVESDNQNTKDQLLIMQKNLIRFITPLGLLALFFGLMMGFLGSDWVGFFLQNWIIAKILIVLVLILYQIFCLKILKDLESNSHNWTGFKLRIFNEIPVLLLLGGIVAAVFKF
jgi:putative membrane protein